MRFARRAGARVETDPDASGVAGLDVNAGQGPLAGLAKIPAGAARATGINITKPASENIFHKLVTLMGKPVWHYLQPSEA